MYIMPIASKRRALLSYVFLPLFILKCTSSQLVVTSPGDDGKVRDDADVKRKTLETNENVVIFEGKPYAKWRPWRSYLNGGKGKNFYACGAKVKVQDYVESTNYDNTAINGLELQYCGPKSANWDEKLNEQVWNGEKGEWMKDMVSCPKNHYIAGAGVRYQNGSGDSMAITGLRIKCGKINNINDGDTPKTLLVFSFDKEVGGKWKQWVTFPKKRGVIAARVKYQDYDSTRDDNIGMHGIEFKIKSTNKQSEEQPVPDSNLKGCYKGKEDCNANANCFWSVSWKRCRHCSDILVKDRCEEVGCSWNIENDSCSSSQKPTSPPSPAPTTTTTTTSSQRCNMTTLKNPCNQKNNCYWSIAKDKCRNCSSISQGEEKCEKKGCSWDGSSCS